MENSMSKPHGQLALVGALPTELVDMVFDYLVDIVESELRPDAMVWELNGDRTSGEIWVEPDTTSSGLDIAHDALLLRRRYRLLRSVLQINTFYRDRAAKTFRLFPSAPSRLAQLTSSPPARILKNDFFMSLNPIDDPFPVGRPAFWKMLSERPSRWREHLAIIENFILLPTAWEQQRYQREIDLLLELPNLKTVRADTKFCYRSIFWRTAAVTRPVEGLTLRILREMLEPFYKKKIRVSVTEPRMVSYVDRLREISSGLR